jgi:CubicO group peptidase (beta-lactamase class C family)
MIPKADREENFLEIGLSSILPFLLTHLIFSAINSQNEVGMKLLITCVFLALTSIAYADLAQTMDPFIESKRAEYQIPGASVSIVEGGKVVMAKGYGVRSIESSGKVDAHTVFQLASVTKTFTAAAIGLQVQNGKMKWDDPIILHFPPFLLKDVYASRFSNSKDLLAHRTGLPPFGGDLLGKLGYSDAQILERIAFITPSTTFRERAQYSNVGYFLAGELLAAVSGTSWQKSIQDSLLTPLSMNRTGFASNLDQDNVASSHALINGSIKRIASDRTGGFEAAGAITSTAMDMAKWMSMFLNGTLLNKETIQTIFAPAIVGEISFSESAPISDQTGFNFSLGWGTYYYKGHLIVEKGGGLDGIRTVVTLIPDLGVGITVLSNLNLTLFPEAVRAKFLEEVLGKDERQDVQKLLLENQAKLAALIQTDPIPENALPLSMPLKNFAGTYTNDLYGNFVIVVESDGLSIKAGPGAYSGSLSHWSNNTFLLKWPLLNSGGDKVTFTFGPTGHAASFHVETLGEFTKIDF